MEKELNQLSKEELIKVVQSLMGENNLKFIPNNKVSVCDVEVESNTETLDHCKKVVNDLIKTNQEFISLRKNKLIAERLGYFG